MSGDRADDILKSRLGWVALMAFTLMVLLASSGFAVRGLAKDVEGRKVPLGEVLRQAETMVLSEGFRVSLDSQDLGLVIGMDDAPTFTPVSAQRA